MLGGWSGISISNISCQNLVHDFPPQGSLGSLIHNCYLNTPHNFHYLDKDKTEASLITYDNTTKTRASVSFLLMLFHVSGFPILQIMHHNYSLKAEINYIIIVVACFSVSRKTLKLILDAFVCNVHLKNNRNILNFPDK